MGVHPLHPKPVEVLTGRGQPDRLGRHWHPCLEALRRRRIGRLLHPDQLDHRASGEEGRHLVEEGLAPPERPNAHRAEHLVPGEGGKVDPQRSQVDRQVRHRLAGVEDGQRADGMGRGGQLTDRVDCAEDIADVGEREDLGPLGQQAVQRGQVELATGGEVDPAQRRAGPPGQLLPRDEVGMVLHRGDEDLVAVVHREPADRGIGEGVRDEVERLGGILREDHLVRRHSDEGAQAGTSTLIGRSGLLAEQMRAAVRGRIARRVVGPLGVEDGIRLLRGGTRVEVHQGPPPTDRAGEDGEVAADRGGLRGGEGRGPRDGRRHGAGMPIRRSRSRRGSGRSPRPRAGRRAPARRARRNARRRRRGRTEAGCSAGSGCSA